MNLFSVCLFVYTGYHNRSSIATSFTFVSMPICLDRANHSEINIYGLQIKV